MKGQPAGGPVRQAYDPDYVAYAAAPSGLAPAQPYSAQTQFELYPQQPMPYETPANYGGSAGYAGGVSAIAVYDPHAQAQAAAYAPSQHVVSPSATPAPEYQQKHQYSAAGPALGTSEPYYSSGPSHQPYYSPQK